MFSENRRRRNPPAGGLASPSRDESTSAATVKRVEPWDQSRPGVLRLPSGRLVRGRGLRRDTPEGGPEFGLYLQTTPPPPMGGRRAGCGGRTGAYLRTVPTYGRRWSSCGTREGRTSRGGMQWWPRPYVHGVGLAGRPRRRSRGRRREARPPALQRAGGRDSVAAVVHREVSTVAISAQGAGCPSASRTPRGTRYGRRRVGPGRVRMGRPATCPVTGGRGYL